MQAGRLLRLLSSAPTAARLYAALQRAQKGDREALDYLRREGWVEAIDLIAAPGAGELAREALHHVAEAVRVLQEGAKDAGVVDAEYREVDPPWAPFLKRLFKQAYGGHIILGPYGSGKTSLALKLAQRYRDLHGYTVETVCMYGEDSPSWATPINRDTLIRRMRRVRAYLDSLGVPDEDDDAPEQPPIAEEEPTLPAGGKVLVIDEASIGLSPGDPARKAALLALTQCRHLDWVVIYIAQWAAQLPEPLLGQTIKWVKRPAGDEDATDRDNRVVRELWRRAGAAFAELRSSPWYGEPYKDWRAWAYCDCRALDTGPGYSGLIPFIRAEA